MKASVGLLLLSAQLLVVADYASAAIVGYNFTGTVDLSSGSFYGISPAIGDAVTGAFRYDTSMPIFIVDASVQECVQPVPNYLEITLRGVTFRTDGSYIATVQTNNYFSLQLFDNDGTINVNGNPSPFGYIQLALDNTTAGRSVKGLPSSINLADLTDAVGYMSYLGGGARFNINTLTPIPEPQSVHFLSVVVFAAVAARAGRRK